MKVSITFSFSVHERLAIDNRKSDKPHAATRTEIANWIESLVSTTLADLVSEYEQRLAEGQ